MNVGIVGIGFMGATHFRAVQGIEGARVSAICDSIEKRLTGDWRDIRGNFGPSAGIVDLTGISKYRDVTAFLADPQVQMVDICLPTPFHRDVAIQALEAGKDVLVEKPIALTLADADAMVAAAERTGRTLMVAQVLRFFPEFAYIKQLLEDGRYGRLQAAHLKRVIAMPNWSPDNWFADASKSGGPAIDLHIHDSDFVRHIAGMPDVVQSTGVTAPDGQVLYLTTEYLFEGRNLAVTASSGAIAQSTIPFEHGYDVYLEKATIRFNSLDEAPVTLYTADGITKPELPAIDGYAAEVEYAIRCLEQKRAPELLLGASARDSLKLALKEIEAVKSGKPVRV